jgi:septum formation protein
VREDEHGDPAAVAEANAVRKARAVASTLTLGADTVVAVDGDVLGKPADEAQARDYLRRLQDRTHQVVGGIALEGEATASAVVVTRVSFRPADAALIDWYLATGEWRGRAGGYAIQGAGAALVTAIDGDYLNVVGLPLARLLALLPRRFQPHLGA